MKPVLLVVYATMALWMIAVAMLRVALSLANGVPIDALPAITGGIGLLALLILIPRIARRARGRPAVSGLRLLLTDRTGRDQNLPPSAASAPDDDRR